MSIPAFALFDTAIGRCAVIWGADGLVGTYLPESDESALRNRMRRRFPDAAESEPPPAVAEAIAGITALLTGEKPDLLDVRLDMSAVPPFHQRVYAVARAIPPGETLTYGEIARRLGAPREAARAVGEAMGRNPFPIVMPCHRVLGANGKPGGFSAPGGVETKLKMLAIEGAKVGESPTLFDDLPLAVKPQR
ncbi:methylated-DNA--[protein]-cysteine S-methyltransferase [Caulobacter mirabilis]|uniref:methylated-DNA--[protein]-cysteine S-methyltransferase n=1 Tax=Caulobacter mirabilis TaxID=69666 RepID=A0A2D2AX10_9CAUL|nr:methylated-DNA--[protein]-cysteine S-methyltransferase [Caulobacter mirabilis]ATQ42515.1 cysteine methyltransferase [Caulobacter mirabilis]